MVQQLFQSGEGTSCAFRAKDFGRFLPGSRLAFSAGHDENVLLLIEIEDVIRFSDRMLD